MFFDNAKIISARKNKIEPILKIGADFKAKFGT